MKKIKNFQAFNEEEVTVPENGSNLNDPVKKAADDKTYFLASNVHRQEFFSKLKKEQKEIIMKLRGQDVEVTVDPHDPNSYIMKTGNDSFPECRVPKRVIYEKY